MTEPRPGEPVLTGALFAPLGRELTQLLERLGPAEWTAPASAGRWEVRDVAAHLLDGALRRVSVERDGHALAPDRPPAGYADLVAFLDDLNAGWVTAARRLSPRLLTELLAFAESRLAEVMESVDPRGEARYGVAWAGPGPTPGWLDVGREYTERWHHQDQIRGAVGAPPLDAPRWLEPVLRISVLALPRAYRGEEASPGTRVVIETTGAIEAGWTLERAGTGWALVPAATAGAECRIRVAALELARLLLHRRTEAEARASVEVTGDRRLAEALLRARAVMV